MPHWSEKGVRNVEGILVHSCAGIPFCPIFSGGFFERNSGESGFGFPELTPEKCGAGNSWDRSRVGNFQAIPSVSFLQIPLLMRIPHSQAIPKGFPRKDSYEMSKIPQHKISKKFNKIYSVLQTQAGPEKRYSTYGVLH